jgi:flagellar basal-body rod modification protein FlgD
MITSSLGATSPAAPASTASQSTSTSSSAGSLTDPMASEQTFLKLLVAQLQNQDPTQPQDSLQFVSQLAQFAQLEQSVQMREDLDSIKADLTAPQPSATTPTSTT